MPINQKYGILNGRNILQKKYRDAKNDIALETRVQWPHATREDMVTLNIMLYFGDKRRRDIDAYLKILLDAMEGVVYTDDALINEMHVYKDIDVADPRVEIQVL